MSIKKKYKIATLATYFTFLSCSSIGQQEMRIHVHKEEFENYTASVKNLSANDLEGHYEMFKKHIILGEKNKELYLDTVFAKRKEHETFDDLLRTALKNQLPTLIKNQNEINSLFNKLHREAEIQLKNLSAKLPGFKYSNLPIYGMLTLQRSLGGRRTHQGQTVLIFGIDEIARKKSNIDILFAHEVFHAYHFQVNKRIESDLKTEPRLLIAMSYIEGLATHASGILNPGHYEKRYLDRELKEACESGMIKKFIPKFLKDSTKLNYSNFKEEFHLASKWFYTKRKKEYSFPPMTGYCIGERAIKSLSKKYSLEEMSKWPLSKAVKEAHQALKLSTGS